LWVRKLVRKEGPGIPYFQDVMDIHSIGFILAVIGHQQQFGIPFREIEDALEYDAILLCD
jgi:hypothetical protein